MRIPQRDEILEFLKENRSITHRQAEDEIGCTRVAARVGELRKMGYRIKTDMIPVKNRKEQTVYIARYTLEG